jgi:ribosomal protein L34E
MGKRTRTEVADELGRAVRVWVRKAHERGEAAMTNDLIHEIAQARNIHGGTYSMRTVWTLIRRECRAMDELHFIPMGKLPHPIGPVPACDRCGDPINAVYRSTPSV